MNEKIMPLAKKLYGLLISVGDLVQHPLLLLFRLYWGWSFVNTGLGKLQNHEKIVKFFTGLGIPLPDLNAWFVGGVECLGGFLLCLGLASRPVAFMLASTMVVAYLTADREALLSIFSDPDKFLQATPFLFLTATVLVFSFGPGKLSVDFLLGKHVFKHDESEAKD